jgi:hypothetical protein
LVTAAWIFLKGKSDCVLVFELAGLADTENKEAARKRREKPNGIFNVALSFAPLNPLNIIPP